MAIQKQKKEAFLASKVVLVLNLVVFIVEIFLHNLDKRDNNLMRIKCNVQFQNLPFFCIIFYQ